MSRRSKAKESLKKIPVVGPILQRSHGIFVAPKRIRELNTRHDDLQQTLLQIQAGQQQTTDQLTTIVNRLDELDERVSAISHRQTMLNQQLTQVAKGSKKAPAGDAPAQSSDLFADDHSLDSFYLEFENKFRGKEEEIEKRLEVYIPRIKASKVDFKKYPLVDLGCGRGEMLNVMKKHKIRAIGVDLNEAMVERSKELGFEAILDDAIGYIEKQPENSLGAITAFHLVEHVPFQQLIRLFTACHRALVKGGFVIFETPNPENLRVGAWTFYMDPSHLHPLPPLLLEFALQTQGFDRTEIVRLHPIQEFETNKEEDVVMREVKDRLFGAQDYSVVAFKL